MSKARRVAGATLMGLLLAGCASGSPSPSQTPPEPSQSAIFGAAAAWLSKQDDFGLPTVVFVNEEVNLGTNPEEGLENGVFRDAGPPEFGDALSNDAFTAIAADLGASRDVRRVPNAEAAEDRGAEPIFGCYPLLEEGALLSFYAPRPTSVHGERYLVYVWASRGCEFISWTLGVTWDGGRYSVTEVEGGDRVAV